MLLDDHRLVARLRVAPDHRRVVTVAIRADGDAGPDWTDTDADTCVFRIRRQGGKRQTGDDGSNSKLHDLLQCLSMQQGECARIGFVPGAVRSRALRDVAVKPPAWVALPMPAACARPTRNCRPCRQ